MPKFVRIHPKDPRRGFNIERYIYRGVKFETTRGWYEVSNAVAAQLAECVQDPNAPIPIPVFQVADKKGAVDIERKDYERLNPERKISEAISGAQTVTDVRFDPEAEPEPEIIDEEAFEDDDEDDGGESEEDAPLGNKENPF